MDLTVRQGRLEVRQRCFVDVGGAEVERGQPGQAVERTEVIDAPGEAHEQIRKTELQGRYFEDVLVQVLDQVKPESQEQ